jgi:hypothetical protein
VAAKEKLVLLYPEQYLRTQEGRKIAAQLHAETVDYINPAQ